LPAEIRETEVITDTNNSISSEGMKGVVPKEAPPLSMTDLHNTLKYSLYNEVDRYSVLNETKLVALKKYFSIIYKYFPFDNENVRRFFKRMNHWFSNKSKEIKVEDLKAAMKISDGYLKPILDWKHCNGSKPQFRGYPCGLWSLFHVLTVNEYIQSKNNSHEVLHTMRNFIINFFSCESCAEHFAEASVDLDSHLVERESSVLWLWRIHNQVNQRLKGTESEDPFYPKVQYPTQLICPDCYKSNSEFDDQNVLKFLTEYYNKTTLTKNGIQILNPSKILLYFYLIICYFLYIFNTR
jgi:thiol oxidase